VTDEAVAGRAPAGAVGEAPAAAVSESGFGRTFHSLRNRDVRYLTISSTALGFGQWGQQLAQGWLILQMTGSAAQLGAVVFVSGLLALLLMPLGGILADRYPRRTVIVVTTIAGSVQAVVLAVLVMTGAITVWEVYLFAVVNAVTIALTQPARQAYVFDSAGRGDLSNAVAMNSIAQNLSRIVGPPLAGTLTAVSLSAPFIFVAAVRGVATWTTMLMNAGRKKPEPTGRHPFGELVDGIRYVSGDQLLGRLLVVLLLPSLLVFPYLFLMPVFAKDVLHVGSIGYGFLLTMGGIGAVTGLIALAYFEVKRRGLVMLCAYLGYVFFVAVFSQSKSFPLSLLCCMFANVCLGSASALNMTIFQFHVRSDMRGRGMAAMQMATGTGPIGALPMGLAVAHLGPQRGVIVFDIACFVLLVFLSLRWKSLREV
jgi:MFS family permease